MKRVPVSTQQAPAAVGPYSQAILTDGLLFCSGQLGLDPETGTLRDGIDKQTQQAVDNLRAVLTEAGTSLDNVVKTTIFVTDMGNFGMVNAIYGAAFNDTPPARSTVEVSALPLGGLVEIEAIALVE